MSENRTIRIAIQQPLLPDYRVPVFEELSQRPGLDITVYYGDKANSPANAKNIPFNAELVHLREARIGNRSILWHAPQITCATRKRCDVLVLSWDLHYASLIPGLLRAKANGVRTILWGHGYSKNESGLRQSLRDRVGKLADAVLLYDQATADRCIKRGFEPNKVFVAPNAIDQKPIQAARQYWLDHPQELDKFKYDNNLTSGPILLFVARLEPARKLEILLDAVAALILRFPTMQVIIIGKGTEEQQRLEHIAEDKGISICIRFLGPVYGENALAPWFLSSDIFCFPSHIGLSLMHAFGYALPVVTTRNRSSHGPEIEALVDGRNGMFYDDGDAMSLADTLQHILSNRSLQEKLSIEAHTTVTEKFSIHNMVDGFEAAIRGHSA